jgi:hypothetical protein
MSRKPSVPTAPRLPKHPVALLLPFVPPWLAWLFMPVAAILARTYWATDISSAMLAAAGIVVCAGSLTAFTWHVFRARGNSVRLHATASVAGAGIWLLVAVVVGLRSKPVWSVWLLAGIGICAAWNLRRVARGDGADHHEDGGDLTKAVGLAGARVGRPKVEGPKVTAPLQLVRGEQVTKDAQDAKSRIASHLGVRPGAVRVIENPDDESRPTLIVVPKDQLIKPIAWRGPTAPGESIAEKVEFATYEDGGRAGLWFPGQHKPPRPGVHLATAGMTGTGKTETGLIICTDILTRDDASLVYIDPVKGLQSVAPIVEYVDLPLIDRPSGQRFMKRLPTIIRDRTHWLGQHGFKQWVPGCGLKYLIVWVEESADLIADSAGFVKTTEQARSAGISLVVSQQRMSHDRIETSARENLGGGLCFGVSSEVSAGMVLSDETIDAGAAPWTWKNEKPGYLYLEAPGVPRDRWPMQARSDLAEAGHLTEVLRGIARGGFDQVTGDAIGEQLKEHWAMVAAGQAPWQAQIQTATKMPTRAEVDDRDDDDILADYEFDVPANPEPGFMDDVDADQEIGDEDTPVIEHGVKVDESKMGRAEAVAELRREIEARASAGIETVRPSELVELRHRVSRSPAWLSGELAKLVAEGVLEEDPDRGVYGIPSPVPA